MTGARVDAPTPETLGDDQRQLYERIVGGPRGDGPFALIEEDGSLTGPFSLMLLAPAVGGALSSLGEAIRYRSTLDDRIREIAILTVAAHRRDAFEWHAHERVGRRMGMSDGELDALRTADSQVWADPVERTAHRAALDILAGRTLDDDAYAAARGAFGTEGLVEFVTLVGYYDTLSLLMGVFRIGAPRGEPDPFM